MTLRPYLRYVGPPPTVASFSRVAVAVGKPVAVRAAAASRRFRYRDNIVIRSPLGRANTGHYRQSGRPVPAKRANITSWRPPLGAPRPHEWPWRRAAPEIGRGDGPSSASPRPARSRRG